MRTMLAVLALVLLPALVVAEDKPSMMEGFDEIIFEVADDAVIAPRAEREGNDLKFHPGGPVPGWTQTSGVGYYAFDADDVFPKYEGTLEITVVVMDADALSTNSDELEALVTLYDRDKTPFFAVGMNAREVSVGSFPLHPVVLEKVFGGTSFLYLDSISGPLEDDTKLVITVTWGTEPADNRVYVNGRFTDVEHRESPRYMGVPGFEPEALLGSYMDGFDAGDGSYIGPPHTLVIGRIGAPARGEELSMRLPQSVAIKRVRVLNSVSLQ